MKILYINPDPPNVYRYYSDLENALSRIVVCNSNNPDVIVYGLNWLRCERPVPVKWLVLPQICFVHKIGLGWERKERFLKTCDLVLSSVPELPIKHTLFRYGVDPAVFYDRGEKIFDFGFSGALHEAHLYPPGTFENENIRSKTQELARKQTDLSLLFLNGSDSIKPRIRSYEKYAEVLSQAKIWMSTTGPNGDIGPRYYEVMASKTLLFCDRPPKKYRRVFRDGVNCVWFDLDNFTDKLRYYIDHEQERNKIIETAHRECITNHTWRARALELIDIINATLQRLR